MPHVSWNPTTNQPIQTHASWDVRRLEQALEKAHGAQQTWAQTPFSRRAEVLRNVAIRLRAQRDQYATLMTQEMGKPLREARAEVEKCAGVCDYYAQHGEDFLRADAVESDAGKSYVAYYPLGVVLAVMPWNFPFWQVFRAAAPALMAGNAVALKHASNVPQSALACERVFRNAGFPEGVFQTLLVGSSDVETILRDKRIKGVSLTGSEKAGSIVAGIAGTEIKPVVMELGGSDPFIVLKDADIQLTCEQARISRLLNGGQVCISAKRFLVHSSRAEEFTSKLKDIFEGYTVGDPMDETTQMGPMSSESGLRDIARQVKESVDMGATVLTGGKQLDRDGIFYTPTILTNVTPEMPAWKEETFGPVATVMVFDTIDEAIALANDSSFGLGASLFTNNMTLAKKIIPRIESGMVFVNGFVKTDPRLPTGGIKRSGVGRELGFAGIRAFTNMKTVWIK